MLTCIAPQKIKINIKYRDASFTITTLKHKPLSYIKTKIYNHFFPMKHNITLFYLNQNLSEYEMKPLGFIFKQQQAVTLQVKETTTTINNHRHTNNYNRNAVSLSSIDIAKSNQRKLPPIDTNKLSINNKTKYNCLPISISAASLSPAQTCKSNVVNINCFDCSSNQSSFYCRTCNKFICAECLMYPNNNAKVVHEKHKTICLERSDWKKSIDAYKEKLLEEVKEGKEGYEKVESVKEREVDLKKWKEKLGKEVDGVVDVVLNVFEGVPKQNYKVNEGSNSKNKQSKFEQDYTNTQNKLNSIEINKYKDPFALFETLNKLEKDIDTLFLDSVVINQQKSADTKVDSILTTLINEFTSIKASLQRETSI